MDDAGMSSEQQTTSASPSAAGEELRQQPAPITNQQSICVHFVT